MNNEALLAALDLAIAKDALDDFKLFVREAWHLVDPAPLQWDQHLDAICEHLQAVSDGLITRLIINIPPRHSKTLIVSVLWPAWVWARNASKKFIITSASDRVVKKANTDCRRLVESDWYREAYGVELQADANQIEFYETTDRGFRQALTIGGKVTGSGADIIVIDDPLDAKEAKRKPARDAVIDWFFGAMLSRLNDQKTGVFVIVMQRLHEDDLCGHLLRTEPERWNLLCLPARFEKDHPTPSRTALGFVDPRTEEGEILAPSRFDDDDLDNIARPGSYEEASQLQMRPAPRDGGFLDRAQAPLLNDAPPCTRYVRRWDLAATANGGDYTAGVLLGKRADGEGYVVLDVIRKQIGAGAVRKLIRTTAEADKERFGRVELWLPQEPGQSGKAQRDSFADEFSDLGPRFERESEAKEIRVEPVSAQWEIGRVAVLNRPWTKAFLDECAVFPQGKNDDQVDGLSGAHYAMQQKVRGRRAVAVATDR